MDQRIQSYLRASASRFRDTERVGPFLATFNPEDANPYLNYAIPDDDALPAAGDVDALVAAYERRGRKPRLEFISSLAPAVEPALLAAAFEVEGRLPLMTCRPGAEVLVELDGLELVEPVSDDELHSVAAVQHEAYAEEGPVRPGAIEGLRRTLEAGGVVALARDAATGQPAGAGLCTAPEDGLTELTSVGVRTAYRRRGIAAAVTAWLAHEAFARGVELVFLMAAGEGEARIYARAGFSPSGDVLHISR